MRNFAQTFLLVLLWGTAHAEVAVPTWTQPVIDLTGTLTQQQVLALNQRLAEMEQRKGAQIGILIVPSTKPESLFQFTLRVFESWKPGRKGVDDGILFTVAKQDGTVFIMTGYGMEGPLPDARVKDIVSDIVLPRLKRGEFYGGIDAGVSALIAVVESEPLPPPEHSSARCFSVTPKNGVAIPPWTQPVIDLTDTLDPVRLQALNERLAAFEYRKGAQIGVLIVPSSQPEDIAQFTTRVCSTWKLGRDGVDDGVILAVAKDYKQLNITVGPGLDKYLDYATLSQILNQIISPNLMVGEFDAGINDGVDAIMKVIDKAPLPPPDHSWLASISRNLKAWFKQYFGETILIFLFGIVGGYFYARRRKAD
jgi:uncharacterized membrane protein YgcG